MAASILQLGARCLIGAPGVSCPGDWWFASILWTDGSDVLVHQGGIAGVTPHNALHPVEHVRAVGDYPFLAEFKRAACLATDDDHAAVREAEQALGRAREAVWERLREIGAHRPGVEAPEAKATRRRDRARRKIGLGEAV